MVKNLALLAQVSLGLSSQENLKVQGILEDHIETFDLTQLDLKMIPKKTKVFFNGNWVGFTDNPDTVVDIFKSIRRKQKIEGVSVVRDIINKEIRYDKTKSQSFNYPQFCYNPIVLTNIIESTLISVEVCDHCSQRRRTKKVLDL